MRPGSWKVERQRDAALGEEIARATRPGFPTVLHCRRPGLLRKFALVGVDYGSVHQRFRLPGARGWTHSPAGVAHFLEHQLFEGPSANAFEFFSELGASANAYTDFNETAYHVQCVDRFGEAFAHLLRFVRAPHFTEASVAKERGVIAQEIRMYSDDADSVSAQNLLAALYAKHPVRIDIAGTVESIRRIRPETLYACYWGFYHPAHMAVVAVADLPWTRVLAVVEEAFAAPARNQPARWRRAIPERPVEPRRIARGSVQRKMPIAKPKALVGFKEGCLGLRAKSLVRSRIEMAFLGDLLFGSASSFYQQAYADGWIDEDFAFSYQETPDYGYSAMGGRTPSPSRLRERILAEIDRAVRDGIPVDDFERVRTKAVGEFLRVFHSPSALGQILASCHFAGASLFDYRDALWRIRPADLARRLASHFRPEASTMSILLPV